MLHLLAIVVLLVVLVAVGVPMYLLLTAFGRANSVVPPYPFGKIARALRVRTVEIFKAMR